ncbi:MAG: hypothetical protein HYY06_31380 [Deltaproteobacteria bacterium]|nr:hypothetical protein [Deltaproteobacteria bacterium]
MQKNEVYSWRIRLQTRAELEAAARRKGVPLAAILDEIAGRWLEEQRTAARGEEEEQERVREAAALAFGRIRGGKARRSERARDLVRDRLRRRRAR